MGGLDDWRSSVAISFYDGRNVENVDLEEQGRFEKQ